MEISKTFTFESSHMLPKHKGKCKRLHGHSWVLTVYVNGDIDPGTGFVMDYGIIKENMEPLITALDHHHLGTWDSDWLPYNAEWDAGTPEGFYPSSENLILWIAERLSASYEPGAKWSKLELNETCTSKCILTRNEYENIRNAERLESVSRKEP
jgi:6-pyruvoyltetrahydropterin/6-carboxytetrahydropterin synthase